MAVVAVASRPTTKPQTAQLWQTNWSFTDASNAMLTGGYDARSGSTQADLITRDHLGSVRELLNSSGTIVARYSYDPYGRTTLVSGSNLATKQYAKMYMHQTSGLYLPSVRGGYDANLGRFIQRDPIEERGGLNLYEYVSDDPIDMNDPSGLAGQRACLWTLWVGHFDESLNKLGEYEKPSGPKRKLGCGDKLGFVCCGSASVNGELCKQLPGSLLPGSPMRTTMATISDAESDARIAMAAALVSARNQCKAKGNCCKSITVLVRCFTGRGTRENNADISGTDTDVCGSNFTVDCTTGEVQDYRK